MNSHSLPYPRPRPRHHRRNYHHHHPRTHANNYPGPGFSQSYTGPLIRNPFPHHPYAPYPQAYHHPRLSLQIPHPPPPSPHQAHPRPLNPLAPIFHPSSPSPGPPIDITLPGILSNLILTHFETMLVMKNWFHHGPQPAKLPALTTLTDVARWAPHRWLLSENVDWEDVVRRLRSEAWEMQFVKGPGRLEDFLPVGSTGSLGHDSFSYPYQGLQEEGGGGEQGEERGRGLLRENVPRWSYSTPPAAAAPRHHTFMQNAHAHAHALHPIHPNHPLSLPTPTIEPLSSHFPLLAELALASCTFPEGSEGREGLSEGPSNGPLKILWELDCYALYHEVYMLPREGEDVGRRAELERELRRVGRVGRQTYGSLGEFVGRRVLGVGWGWE